MTRDRAREILSKLPGFGILVIGDLILDEFVWGTATRISPEAPVPVVEVTRESYYPGGAANVARNLREFAGRVYVMGLVGADRHADHLARLLGEHRISLDCLQRDANYQTIVKTRIIVKNHQVVRVDREKKVGLSAMQSERALRMIEEMLPRLDAIIFEDYGKGLLQQEMVDRIISLANKSGKVVTVDPNPRNRLTWNSVTAVTPNRSEAFAAAGIPWVDPIDPPLEDTNLLEVGAVLQTKWKVENLLITLGEQGMMLFAEGRPPFSIPTRAQEVFDVSGAGDTAIALFTLALCGGASAIEAADISNHASGIVVGKLGTATVTKAELLASFEE